VSKAFGSAAADIGLQRQEIHHAALVNKVMHAIKGAEDEWARSGWDPADKERIGAGLAAALQNLDHVIVQLDRIGFPLKPEGPWDQSRVDRGSQMIEMFMDVLARHPRLRALEATAMENRQLSCIAKVVGKRPDLLCSLVVRTTPNWPGRGDLAEATQARAELCEMRPRQENLTTLDLQHAGLGMPGRRPLNLRDGGLDKVIAKLRGLKCLALSHHQLKPDDANALAAVLRQLPALQDLHLLDNVLDAAGFSQIASSLPPLPHLRSLNLQGTSLAGASAGHLAHVLPGLAKLQILNLANTGLVAADMEHLADGLAGLKQLQTLDVSCNQLDQHGRSQLIAALAQVPTLRHLHLRARSYESLPNLDTLRADLSKLAGHEDLQVYLRTPHEFDKPGRQSMARQQAEVPANRLPRIHFID
jgi:hypothetical protein